MKRVIIKNLSGVQTHGNQMDNPASWISDCIAKNLWGLPQRSKWKIDCTPEELTEILSEREVEIRLPDGSLELKTEVTLKARYTVEVIDLQSEIDAENAKKSQISTLAQQVKTILQKGDGAITTAETKQLLLAFLRKELLKGALD